MRKYLLAALLLASAFAVNLTIGCPGNCTAQIPVAGRGYLNFSVNGSRLDDVFTKMFEINVSEDMDVNNSVVKFNLSQYGCANPSAVFLGQDPLESASLDYMSFARVNVSTANTTLKLFCSGFNWMRENADWLESATPSATTENITYNGTKPILSGLNLKTTGALYLNQTSQIKTGRGNITVANATAAKLNITLLDWNLGLLDYYELDNATSVDVDYGPLGAGYVFVVSHSNPGYGYGNITIFNESMDVFLTFGFNETKGVALADINGDAQNEIVFCANYTDPTRYNITLINTTSWTVIPTAFTCNFSSFDRVNVTGEVNESLLAFNSTHLVLLEFDGAAMSTNWYPTTGIQDVASFDFDSDGHEEIVIMNQSDILVYNVTSIAGTSLSISQRDYLGNLGNSSNARIDFYENMTFFAGNLSVYTISPYATEGYLKYVFPAGIPLKLELNFSTSGTGNVTLNVSSGDWYTNTSWTEAINVSLNIYPDTNKTVFVNFTLSAVNSSYEPSVNVTWINAYYADSLNYTQIDKYSAVSFTPNTTLLSNRDFWILGADFVNDTYLNYITVYLNYSGNHTFQIDSSERAITLSIPAINPVFSSRWFDGTNAVQPSQTLGNFSGVVVFENRIYFPETGLNLTAYNTTRDFCGLGEYFVYTWGNATVYRYNSSLYNLGNITGNFSECWMNGTAVFLVNSAGGIKTYNYSLQSIANFTNSSFVALDVAYTDRPVAWNGTHSANFSGNSFTIIGGQDSEIFVAKTALNYTDSYSLSSDPALDVENDTVFEKIRAGLFSVFGSIARLFSAITGKYSSSGNNVTVALDNGTFYTYSALVSKATAGWFTQFQSNVSQGAGWVAVNTSEALRINITAHGFIYNDTDTLNDFELRCVNSTGTRTQAFTKYNVSSFYADVFLGHDAYACRIVPVWDVAMTPTLSTKDFTLYVDADAPAVNNATSGRYISSGKEFNLTVNVTDDSRILNINVTLNFWGVESSSVSSSNYTEYVEGEYLIYVLPVTATVSIIPTNMNISVKATDYTGKVSTEFQTENITVYSSNPPSVSDISFHALLEDGYQAFATVPVNFSITASSGTEAVPDANLSILNVSLWLDQTLIGYENYTGINNYTKTVWFNRTLNHSLSNYTLRVNATDITNNIGYSERLIQRYNSTPVYVTGIWRSGTTGTTEIGWENTFAGGVPDNEDYDSESSRATGTSYSVFLSAPKIPVTKWYIIQNASVTFSYIKYSYENEEPSNVSTDTYYSTNLYAFNFSSEGDVPETFTLKGSAETDESEYLCMYVCREFNFSSVSTDKCVSSNWVKKNCGSVGADFAVLSISSDDSRFGEYTTWTTGVALKMQKDVYTSSTQNAVTQTQTIATPTTAVVRVTTPTSASINVSSCGEVKMTIKNTGSITATIQQVSTSGFSVTELTSTQITDLDTPFNLLVGETSDIVFNFCPLIEDTWNVSLCAKVSNINKCSYVRITGAGRIQNATTSLNVSILIDRFNDEYIVTVNSSIGVLGELPVQVLYENGTIENYTTNAFGKFTFTPLNKDFTIKVNYLGQTVQKVFDTNPLFSGLGLTLGRIFIDLIIIAALMGLGIVLDEKLI